LSIERIRDEISWVWNPTTYKAFLDMLSGLGNPEVCFLSGINAFFIEHEGYNDLRCAAEGGNDAAAYLYAILLHRYDIVEMAEQRGVSAFAREDRACAPLLDLAHLG
jgi:hypothetical protein